MPINAITVDPVYVPQMTAYYRQFDSASTDSLRWLRELDKLLLVEDYNGVSLRPSTWAYDNARHYLEAASEQIFIPLPEFTPDGEQGIDIEWDIDGRRLALSCRGNDNDNDFISWREPEGRYEGAPASRLLLINRLGWLTS